MNVAIVGYATEGIVSASYWYELGNTVTICDQNTDLDIPDEYKKQLGNDYAKELSRFDIVVRSAGIHPTILLEHNPTITDKITTNIEEFMRVSPSRNIIGITGTKGKGTTSTLIHKMLRAAGKTSHLGGNIGIAALSLLTEVKPEDYVVLEVSSFQLEDFKGPSPHIGVCIMVVPEHLNWHANMDEYIAAKSKLFAYQKTDDIAVYFADNDRSAQIARAGSGKLVPYFKAPGAEVKENGIWITDTKICKTGEVKLRGKHNWQNVCAAITAVWPITQDIEAISSVVKSFSGLEHRIEFVRELDGVEYYDDSFATTPETSIAALQAFDQPKVIILGGSDKGIPLNPIAAEVVRANVRHVIAIGEMAPIIESQLKARGFTDITLGLITMPEIMKCAKEYAQPGDIVLLSTGCASFGLFTDYKDRGNQFQAAVMSL